MKIAIQGHLTKGKEVIQILESLGGKSRGDLTGRRCSQYYFINSNGDIDLHYRSNLCTYKLYTLEEFEKEFPFKIGDKVIIIGLPDFPKIITKITWDRDAILYSFEDSNNTWFHADALKKFEMKEERNITLTLDKAKEWYKKGGELKEIALQAFTEKELTKVDLPKTWEEFCGNYPIKEGESYAGDSSEIYTHCESNGERDSELDRNMCPTPKSAEAHLAMIQLEQLRDCWRNGWEPECHSTSYAIKRCNDEINIIQAYSVSAFLSFPTKEMAEDFLACFRDLIEKARDLI